MKKSKTEVVLRLLAMVAGIATAILIVNWIPLSLADAQEPEQNRVQELRVDVAQATHTCFEEARLKLAKGAGADLDELAEWSWRIVQNDGAAKQTTASEARDAHLKRMLTLEADTKKRVRIGAAAESDLNVIRYHRLMAELAVEIAAERSGK